MIQMLTISEIEKLRPRKTDEGDVQAAVAEILTQVRTRGDEAVREYTQRFDGATPRSLEVSDHELDWGFRQADAQLVEILFMAAQRIESFHRKQVRTSFLQNEEQGVLTGQKMVPLERVGIYVPGGTAAYPSSVLMNAIPAKIAGVKEVIMVTPPGKNGISAEVLAAARIGGVDRIFQAGGAQAIGALAYGTQTIPQVDKIVGPGNQYVAEAKRQVYGTVDIDMIAGPSEVLIIADENNNPAHLAADLLAQAEHDENAAALLLTTSQSLAQAVSNALEEQIPKLSRRDIARASIDNNGRIMVVEGIQQALEISNTIAPEHLELCVENPFDYLDQVKSAGSVFLGKYCPEAVGDYFAGPNHTLPTGGTARFASPLSVDDFVKKIQYTYYTKQALSKIAPSVGYFARREGLNAHARSVDIRMEEEA